MSDDLIPLDLPAIAPRLPGKVMLRATADDAIDALAADILLQAMQCVRSFSDFHIALSGGSTPLPLYRRLMYDPAYRQLPWDRAHMWVVDERRVPFDDERSNFRQLDDLIAQHSGIPEANVHPIMALQDDADRHYEAELLRVLGRRDKGHDRLDFVVLGMGGDAHTASLFPHSPALFSAPDAATQLVRINAGPRVTPPDRVTMTFDLLNAARFVAILVTGRGKRDTIARVSAAYTENASSGNFPVEELPILGIRPHAGELRWYLDHDACPV